MKSLIKNGHKKILIANAPVNPIKNANRGCHALTYSILYILSTILDNCEFEYVFLLPNSQYEDGKKHTIEVGNKIIPFWDCRIPSHGKSLIKNFFLHPLREIRSRYNIRNVDYIMNIGQGDSFSDIYGTPRFVAIDRINKIAINYGKPLCILPQTIGPFDNSSTMKSAIKSISYASIVMARDIQSLKFVTEHVPLQKNVKEYIDVAFFLPYFRRKQDPGYIHVGLNISGLLWHGGYTKDNQFELKDNYNGLIDQILSYFLSLSQIKVHLIGHVIRPNYTLENDYHVLYEIYNKYSNNPDVVLSPLFITPCQAKDYISGMDFFMGARMHATIAAFSSGVPVVPMAYSRKFNGLFLDSLDYKYIVDLKLDSNEKALQIIKSAFKHRDQIKETIQSRLSGVVKEKKKILFEDLAKFLQM